MNSRIQQEVDRPRVLLVEDDEALLDLYRRQLVGAGFDVHACRTGEQGIERLEQEAFDLIVSDMIMPGVDGCDLLRRVRQTDRDLPFVLITGSPTIETAAAAVEYGAFRYLLKPVSAADLIRAAECAIRAAPLNRSKRDVSPLLWTLQRSFQHALDSLWIAFQPIVRASDGSVFGYEALLRTDEPSLPHPGAVLQAAERLGRLHELGRKVRECAATAMLEHCRPCCLFLNLHPQDLLDPMLVDPSSPHLQIADRIVFEITERSTIDDVADATSRIGDLRRLGARIAIDDLGAGYAGLASFVRIEPDLVKLDMSLVRDVDKIRVKHKLVRAITSVCREMGLSIVAEGIETPEERDALIELGCDLLQGFRFARPNRAFVDPVW